MKICDALKQALEGKIGSLLDLLCPIVDGLPPAAWDSEPDDNEDYYYCYHYRTKEGWRLSVFQTINTGSIGLMVYYNTKSRAYIRSDRPNLVQITIEEHDEKD